MIIANLKGGLGNQMFQYALARTLSLKTGSEFKLDITGYPKQNLRAYRLGVFNIEEQIASKKEITRLKYPYGILSMVWRRFNFKILRRHHIGWEPNILQKKGNIYLDGFWQSYKYQIGFEDLVRKDFNLKTPLSAICPELANQLAVLNSVSLHVRRSDYATPKNMKQFGACSIGYYQEAIKIIQSKIPNSTFFVFSDDPEWARNHLHLPKDTIFVSQYALNDYEEIVAMSLCKHNIIANSSFSWWGAWLNENPGKIVIAPDKWFNNNSIKIDDIIPPTWTKIPRGQ